MFLVLCNYRNGDAYTDMIKMWSEQNWRENKEFYIIHMFEMP